MKSKQDQITNWWESKRLSFNILILPIIVFELNTKDTLMNHPIKGFETLIEAETFFWFVFAPNLYYCIGTGIISSTNQNINEISNYKNWILFFLIIGAIWFLIRLNN